MAVQEIARLKLPDHVPLTEVISVTNSIDRDFIGHPLHLRSSTLRQSTLSHTPQPTRLASKQIAKMLRNLRPLVSKLPVRPIGSSSRRFLATPSTNDSQGSRLEGRPNPVRAHSVEELVSRLLPAYHANM